MKSFRRRTWACRLFLKLPRPCLWSILCGLATISPIITRRLSQCLRTHRFTKSWRKPLKKTRSSSKYYNCSLFQDALQRIWGLSSESGTNKFCWCLYCRFSASLWPNGHYVHTLAGLKEDRVENQYWLLCLTNNGPENPVFVDTGKCLLFSADCCPLCNMLIILLVL